MANPRPAATAPTRGREREAFPIAYIGPHPDDHTHWYPDDNGPLFITGPEGSGKTTVLNHVRGHATAHADTWTLLDIPSSPTAPPTATQALDLLVRARKRVDSRLSGINTYGLHSWRHLPCQPKELLVTVDDIDTLIHADTPEAATIDDHFVYLAIWGRTAGLHLAFASTEDILPHQLLEENEIIAITGPLDDDYAGFLVGDSTPADLPLLIGRGIVGRNMNLHHVRFYDPA